MMMPAVSAKAISEALEQAILDNAGASGAIEMKFANRSIRYANMEALTQQALYWRRVAINRGEILPVPGEGPVGVSTPLVNDAFWSQ